MAPREHELDTPALGLRESHRYPLNAPTRDLAVAFDTPTSTLPCHIPPPLVGLNLSVCPSTSAALNVQAAPHARHRSPIPVHLWPSVIWCACGTSLDSRPLALALREAPANLPSTHSAPLWVQKSQAPSGPEALLAAFLVQSPPVTPLPFTHSPGSARH